MTGDVDKQSGCLTGQMCWDCVLVGEGEGVRRCKAEGTTCSIWLQAEKAEIRGIRQWDTGPTSLKHLHTVA